MWDGDRTRRESLAQMALFMSRNGWLIAAVGVPVTLLLRSFSGLFLVIIVTVFWQLLAASILAVVHSRGRSVASALHYHLTPWGRLYVFICVALTALAIYWGLNLVYLAAAFLLAGLVGSFVLPHWMFASLSTHWHVPQHVFAGEPFSIAMAMQNTSRSLSLFQMNVAADGTDARTGEQSVHALEPGAQTSVLLRFSLPHRGKQRLPQARVETEFPLGVLRAVVTSGGEQEVLVYPHIGRLRHDVLRRHKGGEADWLVNLRRKDPQGEFHSLRQYQQGDNPRHIHWPTSARLGKLYVREFERNEMHNVLVLLDAYCPADEPAAERQARAERFEQAISFVATLAQKMTDEGVFYAFLGYMPDMVRLPYDCGAGHLHALLQELALARPSEKRGIPDLLDEVSHHDPNTGETCIVSPGPVEPVSIPDLGGQHAHCTVVVDASEPGFHEYFTA